MYKPNFCVECGERVLRARWYPWTSRRFCKFCTPRSLKARFAWPVILGAALLALGVMTGRSMRQPPPPLVVQNGQGLTVPSNWAPKPKESVNSHSSTNTAAPIDVSPVKTDPRSVKQKDIVTLCGAKTKKVRCVLVEFMAEADAATSGTAGNGPGTGTDCAEHR